MKQLLIINAKIYTEKAIIEDGFIRIADSTITEYGPMSALPSSSSEVRIIDARHQSVLPGFIDLQVNGAGGYLATDDFGANIPEIQKTLARRGTTSFLVATSPCSDDEHYKILKNVKELMLRGGDGATILGVHMEGPFLNPQKSGANNPEFVSLPDVEKFKKFAEVGSCRLMTISPEIGDFRDISNIATQNGIVLSMGHSTATYEQAKDAFANMGISCATHLFNTMNGIVARDPGIIGAAAECEKFCTLISDGVHVHPFNLQLVYKCIGSNRLILITDSAPTAGTEQTEWNFGGLKIFVKGYTCYSENGSIMGSSLTMNKAASIAKKHFLCSTEEIVKMCAENPARLINCFDRKGSIAVGKDADLIFVKDEIGFDATKVIIGGVEFI